LTPLSFPVFENASFFSSALTEPKQSLSLIDIYFTSNPFASLSNATIPAVVLFSCLIGASLIGLDGKERMLGPLAAWNAALTRLTKTLIQLTPLGVFAIGAVAAGTTMPETFLRLEVYFISFAALSLLLAFWILPLLVTAVTPFRYIEVAGIAREALLTAFVTNNAFIVLPILVERSKELMERHGLLDENTNSAAEVIVPVLFNFPNAGKLLTLLFVPFAAWLGGAPLAAGDYPTLFATGIPSYFAKAQVALPFLFDVLGLPHDAFQLYVPTTIFTGKFDSMVTAMNLFVFALLGAGAMGGFLVFHFGRMLRAALLIILGMAVVVIGLRAGLAVTVDATYTKAAVLRQMHRAKRATEIIVQRGPVPPPAVPFAGDDAQSRLDRVRARGTLRIGYDENNLPFSFFNADGELVGLDVELAERIAETLKVTAEFVPIAWDDIPQMLADGRIDIMPGMWFRPNWFPLLRLSDPYLTSTVGFAMLDERRHEFESLDALRQHLGLTIGIPLSRDQLPISLDHYFRDAPVKVVTIEFWRPFFEGKHPEIDAFMMPAEHAASWTLMHPEYSVVVPQPNPIEVPSGFGVPLDADGLTNFINNWIVFAESAGVIRREYNYWVLGQGARHPAPRWSIMRDVLGWEIGR
jgi:Na+/H+-dicarboxylate symporter